VAPGLVQTEMSSHVWQDEARFRAHMDNQPVRHLGQPEASERSSFVTAMW
jgi:hypothetical protein